jgi:hypothetical protein
MIDFKCQKCDKQYNIKDGSEGKSGRCSCGQVLVVPTPEMRIMRPGGSPSNAPGQNVYATTPTPRPVVQVVVPMPFLIFLAVVVLLCIPIVPIACVTG